ncbi:MAG: glycosyltransferase family 87 protein [Anaerolineae bacterium]
MKRYLPTFILLLIGLLAVMSFHRIVGGRKDFFNELWGPAFLLVHGQNPYDTSPLQTDLAPVWFPMAKGLFFPLGWLPADFAAQIWFLFNLIALLFIVALTLKDERSPWVIALSGLFAFFFPPTIQHFVLGQFSIFAMLCLLLATKWAQARRDGLAAFCLAMALTKPQLGLFAAIGLGIFYFQRNAWQGVFAFYAKTFFSAVLLSLPLFLVSPDWPATWLANLRANPSSWAQPSLFLLASGTWKIWSIFIAFFSGLILCILIWQKQAPLAAMEWMLAITPIFAPYIWSWDFVLLLPLWISTFAKTNTRNKIILFFAYLLGWAGMFSSQIYGNGNNQFFWWAPLWFMGILTLMLGFE